MLKKFCLLLLVLCLGFGQAAFADVPSPGPWPRPRPRPHRQLRRDSLVITGINYQNLDKYPDKIVVMFDYRAPQLAEVSYRVMALDGVYSSGEEVCNSGRGTFAVEFPKLTSPGWLQAELRFSCRLHIEETPFGLKRTEEPVYQKEETRTFLIENKDGVCDIFEK